MEHSNQDISRAELEQMIREMLEIQSITPIIRKQLTRFYLEDKLTYKQMARAIVWYIEVYLRGDISSLQPQYGVWFVSSVIDKAEEYFHKLSLDQLNQEKEGQKIVEYQENNIIFHIKSLKHKKRIPKQFDISSIDVKGDE